MCGAKNHKGSAQGKEHLAVYSDQKNSQSLLLSSNIWVKTSAMFLQAALATMQATAVLIYKNTYRVLDTMTKSAVSAQILTLCQQ